MQARVAENFRHEMRNGVQEKRITEVPWRLRNALGCAKGPKRRPRFQDFVPMSVVKCVVDRRLRQWQNRQNVHFAHKGSHHSRQQTAATPTPKEEVQSCKQRHGSLPFHRNSNFTMPFDFEGKQ